MAQPSCQLQAHGELAFRCTWSSKMGAHSTTSFMQSFPDPFNVRPSEFITNRLVLWYARGINGPNMIYVIIQFRLTLGNLLRNWKNKKNSLARSRLVARCFDEFQYLQRITLGCFNHLNSFLRMRFWLCRFWLLNPETLKSNKGSCKEIQQFDIRKNVRKNTRKIFILRSILRGLKIPKSILNILNLECTLA